MGGVLGKGCDLAGAVAGCGGVADGYSDSVHFTYWYYAGTVEKVKADCPTPMEVTLTNGGARDCAAQSQSANHSSLATML